MKDYELKPCPFCGGEAELHQTYHLLHQTNHQGSAWFAWCANGECPVKPMTNDYETCVEAMVVWNHRAAVELDDFFYLPKPKQQLFGITTGLSFDDLGVKATGTIDAYAFTGAVLNWQAEMLNEKIVKRICEVWNPERTCEVLDEEYDELLDRWETELSCGHMYHGLAQHVNYCPKCGAKVVDE